MAFTDFNKLMLKFGENINKPSPQDCSMEDRPGSPFIVLLSKETESDFDSPKSPIEFFKDVNHDNISSRENSFLYNSADSGSGDLLFEQNFDTSYELDEEIDYEEIHSQYDDINTEKSTNSENTKGEDEGDKFMKDDTERSHRNKPMTKHQFKELFDDCGRLVNEHEMRRAIFKGGIEENVRKEVWYFLFELFPFNSTSRERDSIRIEQMVRYEALKIRWKKLLKDLVNDYEGVSYCPKWFTGCSKKHMEEHIENIAQLQAIVSNSDSEDEAKQLEDVNAIEVQKAESLCVPLFVDDDDTHHSSQPNSSYPQSQYGDTNVENNINNKTPSVDTVDNVENVPENNFCDVNISNLNPKENLHDTEIRKFPVNETTSKDKNVNSTSRARTESLNFECTEIDGLSEALADAMLDVENNEKASENDNETMHINTQESLYSKSENIISIDLAIYDCQSSNKDVENTQLMSKEINKASSVELSPQIEFPENIETYSSSEYVNTSINHSVDTKHLDEEIENLTTHNNINKTLSVENMNDKRSSVVKTPTGEEIDVLPPWIAHMMNNSNNFKPISNNNTHHYSSTDHISTSHTVPLDSTLSDICKSNRKPTEIHRETDHHNEESHHNEELLDIVENANRYLQKQIQSMSPSAPRPKRKKSKEKIQHLREINQNLKPNRNEKDFVDSPANSIIMSPVPDAEHLSFMDSPKIKFISRTLKKDVTDGSRRQKLLRCPYCDFAPDDETSVEMPAESMGKEQLKFMGIQAQVFAARQPYRSDLVSSSIRVIDKDVPRTDRELPQFSGDNNPGLLRLRDSLLTYAFFHPEVGYAQGMNDIMSRFLFVTDNEADAYWMFVNYMEHFKNDFMEEGMLRKIVLVEQLLMKMDRQLYDFLQSTDMGLMFCHRWLLLNFKREFNYLEAIRLFEITSSRHLEVSSVEAELERARERARDFLHESGGGSHLEEVYMSPEYPFDIFICVAMLIECRAMIMGTTDLNSVYLVLSNLPKSMDIQVILRRSEELFYQFCRKSVVDCFQVIDELEVEEFRKKKSQSFFGLK